MNARTEGEMDLSSGLLLSLDGENWTLHGDLHAPVHDKVGPTEKGNAMYVRGWTYVMVWSEALKRADKAGQLNGPGIKAASKTLKDFSTGGLAQPLTYTPTDHRASMTSEIFQVQNGKLVKVAEYTVPRTQEWRGL